MTMYLHWIPSDRQVTTVYWYENDQKCNLFLFLLGYKNPNPFCFNRNKLTVVFKQIQLSSSYLLKLYFLFRIVEYTIEILDINWYLHWHYNIPYYNRNWFSSKNTHFYYDKSMAVFRSIFHFLNQKMFLIDCRCWAYVRSSFLLSLQGAYLCLGLGRATSPEYCWSSSRSWRGSRSSWNWNQTEKRVVM